MSDLLEKWHIDAALSLLRADPGLVVYPDSEGNVPLAPVVPYVRVYTSIETPDGHPANSLAGLSSTWVVRWYCHCIGATEYAAAAVAMRVRVALLDQRPVVTGRSCGLIRKEAGPPATSRDESTGISTYDRTDVYRVRTQPG